MEMVIISFKQVGPLVFGMKRGKIREILGPNFRSYRKSPFSTNDTDSYREYGLYLYYNGRDELEFVEMTSPAIPIFNGVNLLQGNIENMNKMLQEFDPNPKIDEVGCIFHKIGIGLYSEKEDKQIEAVSAFARGYYPS